MGGLIKIHELQRKVFLFLVQLKRENLSNFFLAGIQKSLAKFIITRWKITTPISATSLYNEFWSHTRKVKFQ